MPRVLLLLDRIVVDGGVAPDRRNARVGVDAELHHEAGDHPEETGIVEEAVLDEVIKPVGAKRRPIAMDFDDERTFAGVELDLVGRRRLCGERGGIGRAPGSRPVQRSSRQAEGRQGGSCRLPESGFQLCANFFFSRAATCCRHEGRDVAAHAGNLPDQGGGDRANRGRGGQEYRLHFGRHRGIHAGHLHFVIEIGGVAHAAHQDGRAGAPRRGDDEIGKGRAGDLASGRAAERRANLVQPWRAARRPRTAASCRDECRWRAPAGRQAARPCR